MLPETIPPFGRLSFEKVLVKLDMHWRRLGDQEFRNVLSLSRANRKEPNYFLFAEGKQSSPDARFGGARTANLPEFAARTVPLGGWFLPSQNRTSIRCLRSRRTVTED